MFWTLFWKLVGCGRRETSCSDYQRSVGVGLGFHHTVKAVFVDFNKPSSFPSIGVLTLFESGVRRVGSLSVCVFVHGSVGIKEGRKEQCTFGTCAFRTCQLRCSYYLVKSFVAFVSSLRAAPVAGSSVGFVDPRLMQGRAKVSFVVLDLG